jgi:uncharacterized phage protein gp47/JayE
MAEAMDIPEIETLNLLAFGDEPALVSAGLTRMQNSLPEWEPREGNTEVVLLEGLAVMLGPLIMSMQIAPQEMMEQLMALYGVTRDPGTTASVNLEIRVSPSASEKVIPAGTRFRIDADGMGNTVDVLSIDALTINAADTMGVVRARAEEIGEMLNGLAIGSVVEVVDALPFAEAVNTADAVTPGTGVESDTSFIARASAILARQTSTLVLAEHFQYAVASRADVGRARVLNNYNPDAADPSIEAPGHVTVAATDIIGGALPPETMEEIEGNLAGQSLASLTIHVIAPTYTEVDLAVTVRKTPLATEEEVQASVDAVLRAALNPLSWDWAPTVSSYRLVSVLSRASGVAEVVTVPADIDLPGAAPMPVVDSITVTVV